MNWYEFKTGLSAEQIKQRLQDEDMLACYDCSAEILSNDRFYIASTEASAFNQNYVFRGSIRKQGGEIYVVGDFGWTTTVYCLIGILVAVFFCLFAAMGYSMDEGIDTAIMLAIMISAVMLLIYGIMLVIMPLMGNTAYKSDHDAQIYPILFYIKHELLQENEA